MLSAESKKEAVSYIQNGLSMFNVVHDTHTLKEIIEMLQKKNFPLSVASDLVYLKTDLQNESEFIIYNLLKAVDIALGGPHDSTWNRFDFGGDCKLLDSQIYEIAELKFPLKFKTIPIDDDSYIGVLTAQDIIKLRDAQIIYYNENTQRKLRHVVDTKSQIEYYTIDIKQSSVDSIQKLMLNGTYIPDTLVFNMSEDADFYYDAKNCQLVIKSLNHFDIIDGYHRYRAISNLYQLDKNFDYTMMVQFVSYSESKAQQFMWQKDQQTKLRKLDSETLNQDNAGTRVAKKLNEDPKCNYYGKISRNSKVINSIELANIIQCIYFNQKKPSVAEINNAVNSIGKVLNYYPDRCTEKEWRFLDLCIMVMDSYAMYTNQFESNFPTDSYDEFHYLNDTRVMRKMDATRLAKAMGVKLDV